MSSLIRLLLLVFAGLFAFVIAGGGIVLMAVLGSADQARAPLLVSVTAIGAVGLAVCFAGSTWLKRREASVSVVAVPVPSGPDVSRLAVHARWGWLVFSCALASTFAFYVVFDAIATPGPRVIVAALATVAIASVSLMLAVALFRGTQPALVLDRNGFDHVFFGNIRWQDIDGMLLERAGMQANAQILVLGIADDARRSLRGTWLGRMYIKRMQRNGREQVYLRIPMLLLGGRPERVLEVAKALRAGVSPPLVEFWIKGMTAEDIAVRRECAYLNENMPRIIDDLAKRLHDDPVAFDTEAKRQVSAHLALLARDRELFQRAHLAAYGGKL